MDIRTVELYVRSTPDRVWQGLTDADLTARYYYGSPVESTFQPGAPIQYLSADRSMPMAQGTVVAAEPNRRLELRYRLVYSPELAAEQPFHQVYEIVDLGNGTCKLSVEHDEFDPAGAHRRDVASGMPFILSSLKSLLETGEGLPAPGY